MTTGKALNAKPANSAFGKRNKVPTFANPINKTKNSPIDLKIISTK